MNTRGIANEQTDGERRAKVNAVWSINAERRAEVQGWYWMAHPMVRARLNNLISGNSECDAYCRLGQLLHERGWELPIEHALSLGCGFGNLERDLAQRGMVRRVDAYDIAEGAIAEARKLAAEAGLDGIRYHVADLDQLHFEPGTVDVVFAHQSVHHVERLEALYETVQNALRPGGVFHLHEFVGPSRFQWSDTQLGLVNAFLASLPPRLRRLPSGELKPPLRRPTITEMIAADPSEAVRSADIVPTLLLCFDVIEERRIGGTLLHLALGDIAQNFDPESAEDSASLKASFVLEDRAMAEGAIGSDFVIITAMPKNCRQTAHTKTADAKSVSNGSPVPQSKVTSLALHFPPVKRLYAAVRSLIDQAGTLASEQARIWQELMRLSRESAALKTRLDALASEQDERQNKLERRDREHGFVPPGHFYSPIPDFSEIERYPDRLFPDPPPRTLPGIDLREGAQRALAEQLLPFYPELPFTPEAQPGLRYSFENGAFSYADAIFLYLMLRHLRPRRIIEIGSGHSSGVILDTIESFLGGEPEVTFVEPYPELLQTILRPGDAERVTILPTRLQDVPLDRFSLLAENDVLFIDSTHVAKIGSDVALLFNEILPSLRPGVRVHFHDIFYPFEYPRFWFAEGRAWNEAYLLRAFLQFNKRFEIELWNHFLLTFDPGFFSAHMPLCLRNPGASLWLRVTDQS